MPYDPFFRDLSDTTEPIPASEVAERYAAEVARLRQRFEATRDGYAAVRARTALVDGIVQQLYREFCSPDPNQPENFCLAALGGYGRSELFPYSDIDLLFLFTDDRSRAGRAESVGRIQRELWDLHLRVGHSTRTLAECSRFSLETPEFYVSLLDGRYLAGNAKLFEQLREQVIPRLIARDGQELVRNLVEMTRRRHAKHGNTIFHLEPNIKEAPGGLRDYHVAEWLTLIAELARKARWARPGRLWPPGLGTESDRALDFLTATRCFLHYSRGRDDNHLAYELQDQAASLDIGQPSQSKLAPADWMRAYFRYARAVHRLTTQVMDGATPSRPSVYHLLQDWTSRVSNADFSVLRGRVFFRHPEAVSEDPAAVLRLFEFVARHGQELSLEAESTVRDSLPQVELLAPRWAGLWQRFAQVLTLPHAADALRVMHRLGLLDLLLPEFRAIDALVVRDFYHRYTVDEHSFMTIQTLHSLRKASYPWSSNFAGLLSELERPELLLLALLMHDVGKGTPGTDHVVSSLAAVEGVFARLAIPPEDCDTVRFLIASHLEMSATLQRRDVFDPQTIHVFADKLGTTERLKMLCLLTYADIGAVNPEALTPWKAEMLWQLFVATSNYLNRSVDEERFHVADAGDAQAERIKPFLPSSAGAGELRAFLEGLPKRYMAAHAPEKIASHFQMACGLAERSVQVSLELRHPLYELTVVTTDRPFLFASITGALAAWGMNIVEAEAFANTSGTVLDAFRFVDLHRTLELNPSEAERFKSNLVDVLGGRLDLSTLMKGRLLSQTKGRTKVATATEIRFDDSSSSHSTLLELMTQDRPGLLYRVSSALARLGCNIEVALIDTEGQKAIDVFYLTIKRKKLDSAKQHEVRQALLEVL